MICTVLCISTLDSKSNKDRLLNDIPRKRTPILGQLRFSLLVIGGIAGVVLFLATAAVGGDSDETLTSCSTVVIVDVEFDTILGEVKPPACEVTILCIRDELLVFPDCDNVAVRPCGAPSLGSTPKVQKFCCRSPYMRCFVFQLKTKCDFRHSASFSPHLCGHIRFNLCHLINDEED